MLGIADAIKKDVVYDFKLWSELPKDLKEKAVDIDGQKVDLKNIEPTTLVCIETSTNPGSTPFVSIGKSPFALFNKRAAEKGLDLTKIKENLGKL